MLKRVRFDISQIDLNVHCLRGLEAYLSISFNKLMQQKRVEVMESVMNEQMRQRNLGMWDSNALRAVCAQATEWARGRALDLGIEDAKEVGQQAVSEDSLMSWGNESNVSQTPSLCSSNSSGSSSRASLPEPQGFDKFRAYHDESYEPYPLTFKEERHRREYIHATASATAANYHNLFSLR